jgi:hypothetical protein
LEALGQPPPSQPPSSQTAAIAADHSSPATADEPLLTAPDALTQESR